jgi:hypothetical protein
MSTIVHKASEVAPTPSEGKLFKDGVPPELQIITPEELAMLLHRSAKSIRVDVTRNPNSLPPVFRPPGTKKIRFRLVDVQKWMEALAALAAAEKVKRQEEAARLGVVGAPRSSTSKHILERSSVLTKGLNAPLVQGDAQ